MGKSFRDTLNRQLKNPEFKSEWDALEPEYQIIKAMLDAREDKNLTQKDLAEITGINQADISRLERGSANPSLKTIKRLAKGLGCSIKIDFIPTGGNTVQQS